MAMVFPVKEPCRGAEILPDLTTFLALLAWRTRVESSVVDRSAIDKKCRGEDDAGGVELVWKPRVDFTVEGLR